MITITYPPDCKKIVLGWQGRMDQLFTKCVLIEEKSIPSPALNDGKRSAEGIKEIESYLEELETLVNGWYEDRCDKYNDDLLS